MSGSGFLDNLPGGAGDQGGQAQTGILLQLITRIVQALEGGGNPYAVSAFAGPGNLNIGTNYPSLRTGTISIEQAAPAALDVTLPTNGGPWIVADGAGVAAANNITVKPPVGLTILGAASYVINTNWGSTMFILSGTNYIVLR